MASATRLGPILSSPGENALTAGTEKKLQKCVEKLEKCVEKLNKCVEKSEKRCGKSEKFCDKSDWCCEKSAQLARQMRSVLYLQTGRLPAGLHWSGLVVRSRSGVVKTRLRAVKTRAGAVETRLLRNIFWQGCNFFCKGVVASGSRVGVTRSRARPPGASPRCTGSSSRCAPVVPRPVELSCLPCRARRGEISTRLHKFCQACDGHTVCINLPASRPSFFGVRKRATKTGHRRCPQDVPSKRAAKQPSQD